ncbi:PREDICTED: resistin-like beta [Miniopterus natalensis]|uniref:resistin-like beta n=1 Tax=Miniopterus natalensis TaxID=291302 RepID=UPI0007A6B123|nr:PREDICTED: resistin-like beta [Miniopterus natalensis]
MKPTSCCLLLPILLLQLVIPGGTQCSLDSIVDEKINDALQEFNPAPPKMSCTSVTNSGRLSSCPSGSAVTGCACGYGCGSWDIQGEATCHCQCSVVDWTTARCCRLV